jgi:hypothetical protein
MGATVWRYFTPYQADAEQALQTLRREIFERGEYQDPTASLGDTIRGKAERLGEDPNSAETQATVDEALRLQRAIATGDVRGLSRAEAAVVERVRAMQQLADMFAAEARSTSNSSAEPIDALLDRAAESGTHSILDIERTARRRGFAFATPLSRTATRKAFGTERPTHTQVEDRWSDLAETLNPWQAHYVVVYVDGRPEEYAFIGCSGD